MSVCIFAALNQIKSVREYKFRVIIQYKSMSTKLSLLSKGIFILFKRHCLGIAGITLLFRASKLTAINVYTVLLHFLQILEAFHSCEHTFLAASEALHVQVSVLVHFCHCDTNSIMHHWVSFKSVEDLELSLIVLKTKASDSISLKLLQSCS